MYNSPISFPNLGLCFTFSPEAFSIGGLSVHWYGIAIAVGFLLALAYCDKQRKKFGISEDHLINCVLWALPLAVVGSRIYYCIFDWKTFAENPVSCLYIWEGGLAIYGGVIAAGITIFVYTKCSHISTGAMLDLVAPGLLIGQCIGRWGNFANREVFGRETDSLLKMGLTDASGKVAYYHPLFLYESLWNFIGFLILHFYMRKRKFDGEIFIIYIAWYGLGRGILEGMRMTEYNLMIPGTSIPVSRVFAFATCAAAIGLWLFIRFKKCPDGRKLYVTTVEEKTETEIKEETL